MFMCKLWHRPIRKSRLYGIYLQLLLLFLVDVLMHFIKGYTGCLHIHTWYRWGIFCYRFCWGGVRMRYIWHKGWVYLMRRNRWRRWGLGRELSSILLLKLNNCDIYDVCYVSIYVDVSDMWYFMINHHHRIGQWISENLSHLAQVTSYYLNFSMIFEMQLMLVFLILFPCLARILSRMLNNQDFPLAHCQLTIRYRKSVRIIFSLFLSVKLCEPLHFYPHFHRGQQKHPLNYKNWYNISFIS